MGLLLSYTFLLIPYRASLKPNAVHFTDLVNYGPLYENWIYVVFFFLAELFGQFGIVILFWGIANELFTRKQAKRIYHLFIVAGCLGSTLGVFFLRKLCFWVEGGRDRELIEANKLEVLDEVSYFVGGMVLETLLITAGFCFWILNKPSFVSRSHDQAAKGPRMSFLKSLEYIASNKYLIATTCLVIGCAVTTTLTDITYLSYIKSSGEKSYRTPAEFANWKCTDMLIVNAICIVAGLFLTHWIARKFSFKVNAYITPIVTIVLGSLFFMLSFLHNTYNLTNFIQNCFGTTPKSFIAFLGRFQYIAGLAFKYIFFDATKEMVFITMGPQARKKGKSAVDAVGSRFGKALSSFIHMTVLSIFAIREVYKVSHILLVIFMFFGVGWFLSVNFLSKELAKKEKAKARMAQRTR